ncbi:predicted protein [Uncinocarpus reesii 1704]|uniref:Amine oxidase domain-containing protein n=1 Tax=Uncinocarpus reesii (strain UAMH 1704) TaxID=336963 RepID=C4JXL8_UNCRE|nr:uncharacterized protein UREG_06391 [Uncinocarpus reesii 1704]EEP81526.1 predicted protein [Uncinocarpus reesii 1704]
MGKQSVAVVGTGMAGLVTAYLLRQDKNNRFDVEIFEADCLALPMQLPKESRLVGGKARHCESLGRYFKRVWMPTYFVEHYLLPGLASISTCTHAEMLNFPAKDVIDYKRLSHNSPHLRVSGGSFDHVILAVPPNAVGNIFAPLASEMAHITTASVESIIHTDLSTIKQQTSNALYQMDLKPNPPNWIHFRSSPDLTEAVHEDPESAVVVTNFPTSPIDPAKIITRTYFTRTLRTPRSRDIVNRIFSPGPARMPMPAADEKSLNEASLFRNGDGNLVLGRDGLA